MRRIMTSIAALLLGGAALVTTGQPALASGTCGLPTSAPPYTYYDGSFESCWDCLYWADRNNDRLREYVWLCTYNPRNGLTDLHYYPRADQGSQ